MSTELEVSRAIAFFEHCVDVALLRKTLANVAPRAAQQVRRFMDRGGEDSVPKPAAIAPAATAAMEAEALRTVGATTDFAQLQALTRAIGRRVEALSNPPSQS